METENLNQYCLLRDKQPEMYQCFFAFSNEQFKEGVKKANIEGEKIYRGIAGLFGTKIGITKFMEFYDNIRKEISEKCLPQEVYDFEYLDFKCNYSGNDQPAFDTVIHYFGKERAKEVRRR